MICLVVNHSLPPFQFPVAGYQTLADCYHSFRKRIAGAAVSCKELMYKLEFNRWGYRSPLSDISYYCRYFILPIYEYCCEKCQTRFEELVRSSDLDDPGLKCPECGSKKVGRLLSSFSFKSPGGSGPAAAGSSDKNCGPCTKTSCSNCV